MFRKIVSNISFSPSLVGQLSFYARRLKKEELTRRIGLIFTVLALVVQSLAVFSPPEAANASSSADFVRGGVSSVKDFLKYYDSNSNHIKSIYNSLGITRSEIAKAKYTVIGESSRYNWSMRSLYSSAQGQRSWDYGSGKVYYRPMRLTQEGGNSHPVFASYSKTQGWFAIKKDCGNLITAHPPHKPTPPPKPTPKPNPAAACKLVLASLSDKTIVELSGSATVKNGATVSEYRFVVKNASGDIVRTAVAKSPELSVNADSFILSSPGTYTVKLYVTTSVGTKTNDTSCVKQFTVEKPQVCTYNPQLSPNSPDCQPCTENPEVWIKDKTCKSVLVFTKTATNLTQDNGNPTTSASSKKAFAGDKISYTVTVQNQGIVSDKITMKESLEDVLQYATLVDTGGGTFDNSSHTLSWPETTVSGGSSQSRTFVVQLLSKIPLTNTGTSDATSYDCKMTNTFGNTVEINVNCPPEKLVVEKTVSELPHTGPTENMIFAGLLLSVVVYFYARSSQLGKEVRLVRKNVHVGTI